jgi:hypothetical protein
MIEMMKNGEKRPPLDIPLRVAFRQPAPPLIYIDKSGAKRKKG